MNSLRLLPRSTTRALRSSRRQLPSITRTFSILQRLQTQGSPAPSDPETTTSQTGNPPTYLGTAKRLPEFNLVDKVVLVSGAARGLGLVQAEALLEAGAIGTLPSNPSHQFLANPKKHSLRTRPPRKSLS
jgi:hypothetical protein